MLRGLPVADAEAKPLKSPAASRQQEELTIEIGTRRAMAAYRAWARAQRIEHDLPIESGGLSVPVVPGENNDICVDIINNNPGPMDGEILLQVPTGWQVLPSTLKYSVETGGGATLHCRVTPPSQASADSEITAESRIGVRHSQSPIIARGSAKLRIIPTLIVPRVSSAPALDGGDTGWEKIPATFISPASLVSGRVKDATDSSASFRLAHDLETLFVDVDVTDDVVVTNIAPDDIRGHWRSDSVEICIDPEGGGENTMGSFKVGIIPFDTAGLVRAARDADANQGPIEQTAPSMRVVSRRTPNGYRIQAAIPFREFGLQTIVGKRPGFNLIIYDGDKTGAALGENINKSRIAWVPGSGVQSRPEDWGRLAFQ